MFCTNCGTKNPESSKFCSGCGNPINAQPPSIPPPPVDSPALRAAPPPLPPELPPVPYPPLPSASTPAPKVGRMNKGIYMFFVGGGLLLGILLTVWGATDSKVDELLYFSWLPMIFGIVALYVMIFKMWSAIQDGHARMTPGKAVGFMLIPLFNLYWFFQVFYGWAKDFNSYVSRHALHVPKVSENKFLIYVISSYFCFPVSAVMLFITISTVCDSVNALRGN